MDLHLHDRVFIVTGGTRGLGRATADELVAGGACVVVSGRSQDSVDAAVTTLRQVDGRDCAVGVVADNADPATPGRLVAAARDHWGRLDGALISVGGPPWGPVLGSTDEQWTGAFESVFLGGVRLARDIGTELGADGALALVLSTSVRGAVGQPGHLQRPAARAGDGRQDPGRRARPAGRAGQRAAPGPGRHRAGRRARRRHR
ncbi:SDR family NAD(P)-dependent oxidoreductase [Nocardioides sp. TF02-7]|uniref:SDR family NAD(P)-dependent oxidoreductase n=1 Tax=Nocardioides sp. TF02-7 TaxID=2917724 RepID=UPI0023D9DA5B|nr:SDR family NAD(P)-dependent oxidoreductase [Nocardioides sp. TF02-7]